MTEESLSEFGYPKGGDLYGRNGELAEIVADDPRLPEMAPKIIAAIGKVRTWQGEDGFYHALVKRI